MLIEWYKYAIKLYLFLLCFFLGLIAWGILSSELKIGHCRILSFQEGKSKNYWRLEEFISSVSHCSWCTSWLRCKPRPITFSDTTGRFPRGQRILLWACLKMSENPHCSCPEMPASFLSHAEFNRGSDLGGGGWNAKKERAVSSVNRQISYRQH